MLRNPFCILEGTTKECSYLGSVKTLKLARVEEVETLPERTDDGAPTSQAPVGFFPTSFVEYQFSPDTIRFSEKGKLTDSGTIYTQKIDAFHPGTDNDQFYEIARLADGHYILIIELYAGPIKLLGTKEVPFLFNSSFDGGKKKTSIAGSTFEFTGQSDFPAVELATTTTNQSSPCALLTSADWLYQTWDIDQSSNYELEKIYVDENPNGLIIAVTSRPDGTLYDDSGAVADTLVWNASGWYEPQNGPHTISGTWSASISNISVNTGSPVSSCSLNFSQSFSLSNSPPSFTSINYFGVPEVGNLIAMLTPYFDIDGDSQSGSVREFWRADDATGTNETLIHTGSSYTLTSNEGGKYIQMRATPHAATGASPGAEVKTDWVLVPSLQSVPIASNVQISGIAEIGEVLTGSYTYSDTEGDLEGATVKEWYSYTDSGGSIGETLLGTGDTYTVLGTDANRYIVFKVTPHALTGDSPGATVSSAVFGPILQFQTFSFQTNWNPATDGTFDLSITYSGGDTPRWVFEDGSELTGISPSTSGNGLDGTTQTILLKALNLGQLTGLNFEGRGITGTFDISILTGLQDLRIRSNTITTLTGLVATQDFTNFYFANNNISNTIDFSLPSWSNCNLQGEENSFTISNSFKSGSTFTQILMNDNSAITTADLSNCTFSGGSGLRINFNNCTSLSSLSFGASAGTIGRLFVNATALVTLDISGLMLSNQIQARGATSLTGITFGNQTNELDQVLIDNCSAATGSFDLSGFTSLPEYILISSSPFSEILLPAAINAMVYGIVARYCAIDTISNLDQCTAISNNTNFNLDLRNNTMTTGQVNTILDDLLTVSSSGFGSGRTVKIESNSAPDSGPPDGDTAAGDLAALGFTVTTD